VVQPEQWKGDLRFGVWNVRKLYRSGSHTTAAMELARSKLDLGVCRRLGGGKRSTLRAEDYIFLWKRKRKSSVGNTIICTPQNNISS
jgi:hypothetical protein